MRVAAVALCVLVLSGCGGDEEEARPLLPPGRTIEASGEIVPRTSLFGDTVTAQAVVAVDRTRIDPDSLELRANFAPYERVGDVEVSRREVGGETQLVYTTRLRCDEYACLPREGRTTFRFRPARLGSALVRWPPIEVASRVNQSELQAFRYRATVAPVPEATSPVPSGVLAATAFSAAALLALLGVFLLARAGLRAWRRQPELDLPPLERALLLLEWTKKRPDGEDRRRALELLAGALEGEGRSELAGDARALAWADDSPSPEEATALAGRVREARA